MAACLSDKEILNKFKCHLSKSAQNARSSKYQKFIINFLKRDSYHIHQKHKDSQEDNSYNSDKNFKTTNSPNKLRIYMPYKLVLQ